MDKTKKTACTSIQESIEWCEGKPEYAGIMPEVLYISKSRCATIPTPLLDDFGRPTSSVITEDLELLADAKLLRLTVNPDKSTLTSDPQGEYPSQTQLNKLTLALPGVGPEETAACAYLNNNDSIFLVRDMKGRWRLVGCARWRGKITVGQDNGQGVTGTTGTTINVEASDLIAAPFYEGKMPDIDGAMEDADIAE